MRKLLLGLAAAATIAAPIALATGPANAATTCVPTTTGHATFNATQPSGGGGNWVHTFDVNVATDGSFTGSNVIKGLDADQIVTVNETVSGQIADFDHDGVKEVTVAGVRPNGFYTFNWSVTDAPMNGVADNMNVGTVSYVTAQDWNGGALPITFTAPVFDSAQTCTTTADPVVDKDNHGEYVSGAAHAGIKGKDLAKIAQDKTLVGPYKG